LPSDSFGAEDLASVPDGQAAVRIHVVGVQQMDSIRHLQFLLPPGFFIQVSRTSTLSSMLLLQGNSLSSVLKLVAILISRLDWCFCCCVNSTYTHTPVLLIKAHSLHSLPHTLPACGPISMRRNVFTTIYFASFQTFIYSVLPKLPDIKVQILIKT